MTPTTYQKPEIRDANDNIIQQGAFGKNTALANATNDGWIDYVANDLEFLYDLAKDEVVPVPALPASGQTNKTYLLTTTGVSYRWSGTEWVAVSSSEAVGRAESAALLAEQWATKTDGTVDGTEYSAKYYAEQAEASADDAQDTADDMATHLVQIDKNTGGVAKNSKRISNIEKLLQGNLYDYDTDDDVAYTKTVPSGALPYAGIEQIGGKTLVMNQLVQNGNFESASGWSKGGGITSFSVAENVATMVIKGDSRYNHYLHLSTSGTLYASHTYYIRGEMHSSDITTALIQITGTGYSATTVVAAQSIVDSGIVHGIFTPSQDVTSFGLTYKFSDTVLDADGSGTLQNCMLIDLTLMYGSGNEPSTVAEFEAMFPADYYSYNTGTLLSAGVTGVESKSKNLVDQDDVFSIVSGATKVEDYWKVSTSALSSKYPSDIDTSPSPKFTQQTLTMSFDVRLDPSESTTNTLYYGFAGNVDTISIPTTWTRISKTITNNTVAVIRFSYGSNRVVNIRNFQIEANATATSYSPYAFPSFSIPTAVQQLDGYGWSAGSVSNYIDFERKVYVQNVGRVNLGTLHWVSSTSDYYYSAGIANTIKAPATNTILANAVCPMFVTVIRNNITVASGSISVANNGNVSIYRTDLLPSVMSEADLKALLNGVYLYYELATPVETDISQYLTDNLIEVGAGGTLTFENSNGDDYHIPVPSEVTYMIDLQEAIENGN